MGILVNKTKEKEILNELTHANTFITRFMGLMGKEITRDEGLLIRPCNSIHTFFMKMAIDVIFLNNNDEVVHKISNMQKRKASPIIKGSKYVIEAYPGVFDSVDLGDKIEVIQREV